MTRLHWRVVVFCRSSLMGCCFMLYAIMPAHSAGIAIMEQSVKELGQAFSGAPVQSDDASMVFFNPGAMSQVRGRLLSMAGYVIAPSASFQNESSHTHPALGGTPLRGSDGGNAGGLFFVPNVYFVQELTKRIGIGFGFNTPFGMQNGYHSDWKGRYQAIDSDITVFNFNPSLSFKITDNLSVGAGFNVQYLQSKLTNAVDFGAACLSALSPGICASQGLLPQSADGFAAMKGDSVGFGYNFGALYTLNPDTRIGVSYRSRVHHDVHGNTNIAIPGQAAILTAGQRAIHADTQTAVTLPDSVLFGLSHRLHPRWMISTDVQWTHWSLIRELRTEFSSAVRDDVIDLKWQDTWRYAAGVNYFSESGKWVLRTGFAYDQSPVPDAQHRSARIPDSSRYWLTFGLTYAVLKNVHLHAAYAHLFMNDAGTSKSGPSGESLIGQYSNQVNIGGLQMDWRF